ncbi:MAG: hypothetical protein K6B71_00545 [Alphaproteobacteria bacterium]|nr:hypothetical protein [Alphaproteobacteria bacterium]
MRKIIYGFVGGFFCLSSAMANGLALDSNDPLFLNGYSDLLSKTNLYYFDNGLRVGQHLYYGFTSRLTLGANVHYQQNFDNDQDGFSSIDIGGVYRLGTAQETLRRFIYDAVFGLKVGGNKKVRSPDYADSTYYAGIRFGRQYDGVTFAGTLKSSWIFDDVRGMAFIDFIPEVYFRIAPVWRIGLDADLRKATKPHYDEESLGFKLVRQYERTQYSGRVAYEFEKEEFSFGAQVNIVF